MTSSARDEAERLIAAALGAESTALQGAELRRQLGDLASAFAPPTGPARDPAAARTRPGDRTRPGSHPDTHAAGPATFATGSAAAACARSAG